MADLLETMIRLHRATQNDEVPLVKALAAHFDRAGRSRGNAEENRRTGDCFFWYRDELYSIESQVAKPGNTRFSYNLDKVELFTGHEGDIRRCFVVLGCSRAKERPDERVFVLFWAEDLNELISQESSDVIFKKAEDYVVLNPTGLASSENCLAVAGDFDTLAMELRNYLEKNS